MVIILILIFLRYKTLSDCVVVFSIECVPRPVRGRPFIVDNVCRSALSIIESNGDSIDQNFWSNNLQIPIASNQSINQDIAMKFLSQGEGEHASVASFARHSLQLMAIQAPPKLLIASQIASMDEIKHAKICYGIASSLLRSNVGPGTIDIKNSLQSLDLEGILQSVVNEGCTGETIAAVRAQLGAHYARNPSMKDALHQIANDESNHAQLAWNTIRWAIERYPKVQNLVEDALNKQFEQLKIVSHGKLDNEWEQYNVPDNDLIFQDHGLLLDMDNENTEKWGVLNIINPAIKNGFADIESLRNQILSINFTKF